METKALHLKLSEVAKAVKEGKVVKLDGEILTEKSFGPFGAFVRAKLKNGAVVEIEDN